MWLPVGFGSIMSIRIVEMNAFIHYAHAYTHTHPAAREVNQVKNEVRVDQQIPLCDWKYLVYIVDL